MMLRFKGKKGMSIVELMIACLIIVTTLLTMVSVFALFYRMAVKSRNRIYAEATARSMMERFADHHYGDPEPFMWTEDETLLFYSEQPPSVLVNQSSKAKPSAVTFKKKIAYLNGSFVGKTDNCYDRMTVTITWSEASPEKITSGKEGSYTSITFTTEARRSTPDQLVNP